MVSSIPPEDQFTQWRSEFESDILVGLASLAGERMFFDKDSSSGVSGDLDSATTIASYMEGYWGMGKTVSSAATAKRLESGTPGGAQRATGPGPAGGTDGRGHGPNPFGRLADRIEDNLSELLVKAEEILRENERHVLALAHALETHKTLSGEDVTAVMEGSHGPLVDGSPYVTDSFIERLREYHLAAKQAHRDHNQPQLPLPVAEPVYVIADSYGIDDTYGIDASFGNGNGTGNAAGGSDDVIDFGGLGSGNGSHGGPFGAPTFDPPTYGEQDDSGNDES
jgi:hypothetical protein